MQTSRLLSRLVPESRLERAADALLRVRLLLQERIRRRDARRAGPVRPEIRSHSGEELARSILETPEPWADLALPSKTLPAMLTPADERYLSWIGRFFQGHGSVVEVGTWLGASTARLLQGLLVNPRFEGPLHAIDDFVWRSPWMDEAVSQGRTALPLTPPCHHESFEPLFHALLLESGLERRVRTVRAKIADYDGNEGVPVLSWDLGPIEICVVDCGRMLLVNEGWWRTLRPYFLPDRTLIVMQDWQNHKEVPEVWWENTRTFTDGKGSALEIVHEVRDSGIATFLYRGRA